ncbi:MAG: helix-turn-helix transcriptional regulator [Ruminococcus sp.]|nr:helix-turn-helix transcriptional regulator [Ruminococcus sp.]MBR1749351.1 helix-turn-helix transcriptional regulator [Ruminococcus sp.]
MNIGSIGCDHTHDSSFVMDRPMGAGAGLFLLIKTDADFKIGAKHFDVPAGSYVFLRRDTPIRYCAAKDKYTDDWLYFDYDEADIKRFDEIGLCFDKPVSISGAGEIDSFFKMLMYEHYSAERFCGELEESLLECMLLKLARLTAGDDTQQSSGDRSGSLTNIRTKIYSVPEEEFSIDSLAALAGMSRSGFQHSYKRMFGVSPISDIITSRLEKAKRLLSGTAMSIEEVSRSCGYKSSYSFMRQFRNKTGMTPTEYRQQKRSE